MEQTVMETAVETRACRILVVSYDTSVCPPCRIAWVGKDTQGSLPLYLSDLESVNYTGVILKNNGATRSFKILLADMDRPKLRRMMDVLYHCLTQYNYEIAPSSFRMEWRFDDDGGGF